LDHEFLLLEHDEPFAEGFFFGFEFRDARGGDAGGGEGGGGVVSAVRVEEEREARDGLVEVGRSGRGVVAVCWIREGWRVLRTLGSDLSGSMWRCRTVRRFGGLLFAV